jgi:cobalt-zinc-cadmium efflux system protein
MGLGHGHDGGHHDHDHGSGHAHADHAAVDCSGPRGDPERRSKEKRGLTVALGITGVVFFAELIGGWISGSLALRADAGHMFADVVALGISLAGLTLAMRPVDARRTWGYFRLEILTALANGVLLHVVAAFVLVEAWERFQTPEAVRLAPMLGVASIGLVANLVSMRFLSGAHRSLATRGAFLHVLSDTMSSVAVVAGALVMMATEWFWVDAALSALIAILIVVNAWGLVREAVSVLLEGIPLGIEIDAVRGALGGLGGVTDVHDIHIWTITSGMFAFSCHLSVRAGLSHSERDEILTHAKTVLHDRFGIDHSTIQIEGEAWREIGLVH